MEMKNTWTCTYWVTFGSGDSSDSIDLDVPVTDEEYKILRLLYKAQDYLHDDEDENLEDDDDLDDEDNPYEGMTVEEVDELTDFVDRVSDKARAAAREDLKGTGEEEYLESGGFIVGYGYGSVE